MTEGLEIVPPLLEMKPRFTHDCEQCQFLGRSKDGAHDLYIHIGRNSVETSYLARYGDDGWAYTSCSDAAIHQVHDSLGRDHLLIEAWQKYHGVPHER